MVPSPDAISDPRVQTNSNSAEFSILGGCYKRNVKSGSDENFMAVPMSFSAKKLLNANTFFANANGTGETHLGPKPIRRNWRRPHKERQAVFLRRLGSVCFAARVQHSLRPCRFPVCMVATSQDSKKNHRAL